jgi:hypothetical protein
MALCIDWNTYVNFKVHFTSATSSDHCKLLNVYASLRKYSRDAVCRYFALGIWPLQQGMLQYDFILQPKHFIVVCMTYVGRSRLTWTFFTKQVYMPESSNSRSFFKIFSFYANVLLACFPKVDLCNLHAFCMSVIPPIIFWMPQPVFIKLDMYIMAPEPISKAYFINPSHQSVSVCVPPYLCYAKAR